MAVCLKLAGGYCVITTAKLYSYLGMPVNELKGLSICSGVGVGLGGGLGFFCLFGFLF